MKNASRLFGFSDPFTKTSENDKLDIVEKLRTSSFLDRTADCAEELVATELVENSDDQYLSDPTVFECEEESQVYRWFFDIQRSQLCLPSEVLSLISDYAPECEGETVFLNSIIKAKDRLQFISFISTHSAAVPVAASQEFNSEPDQSTDENSFVNETEIIVCFASKHFWRFRFIKDQRQLIEDAITGHVRFVQLKDTKNQRLPFSEQVLDALPDKVGLIDAKGELLKANDAWKSVLKLPRIDDCFVEVGENYFAEYKLRKKQNSTLNLEFYEGIYDVITAKLDQFDYTYKMKLNDNQLWIQVSLLPVGEKVEGRHHFYLIIQRDITATKHLASKVDAMQRYILVASGNSFDGIWDWKIKEGQTVFSSQFNKLTGLNDASGLNFDNWLEESIHEDDRAKVLNQLDNHLSGLGSFDTLCRVLVSDNQYRWFNLRGKAEFEGERPVRMAGALIDRSDQQALLDLVKTKEQQFDSLVNHIPEVFWEYEIEQERFTLISNAFEQVWETPALPENQATMKWWFNSLVDDDKVETMRKYGEVILTKQSANIDYRINTSSGIKSISSRCYPVFDSEGNVIKLAGLAQDVTEQKSTKKELEFVNRFDSLTQVANRTTFMQKVNALILNREKPFAVIFIQIDHFTRINDSMGYDAGDEVLKQSAERINEVADQKALVARSCGDEFALIYSCDQTVKATQECPLTPLLRNLIAAFDIPFLINNAEIFVNVSIGASVVFDNPITLNGLLSQADEALRRAKDQGGSQFYITDSRHNGPTNEKMHILSELRLAYEQAQFILHYQPKIDIATHQVIGFESLIRWKHPTRGMISPAEFIPALESSGLINNVGEWVLEESIKCLSAWHEQGYTQIKAAINVSAVQLEGEQLYGKLVSLLRKYNIEPRYIELEVTESALMTKPEAATKLIGQLKSLGVSIAVDDFGTGFSSLSYLKRFRPNVLKIDRSFIMDIDSNKESFNIVDGIIQLSHKLGIQVVAEGVETAEQLSMLAKSGCDLLQGFYFSKPLPADEFTQYIDSKKANIPE